VVMVIPHMGQFDVEARYRSMYDFRFQESEVDWNMPQQRLKEQVDLLGLPELDLLPLFRARLDKGPVVPPRGYAFRHPGSPGGRRGASPLPATGRMAAHAITETRYGFDPEP